VSMTCSTPGCAATATLQLFNGSKEEGRNCRFSFHVHATDYDNDESLENVEFLKINDLVAVKNCNPGIKSCNLTAGRPLHSCVNDLLVDNIVDSSGTIRVEGKNSKMVDDCPYKGNLLSGIAVATCMVRERQDLQTTMTTTFFSEALLACAEPGCQAESFISVNQKLVQAGSQCHMNLTVTNTDFDDSAYELIEFFAVDKTNMSTGGNMKPGKNPCNIELADVSAAEAKNVDRTFSVLTRYDVTDLIKNSEDAARGGCLNISSKISDYVDECKQGAFDGIDQCKGGGCLLLAKVTIGCTYVAI